VCVIIMPLLTFWYIFNRYLIFLSSLRKGEREDLDPWDQKLWIQADPEPETEHWLKYCTYNTGWGRWVSSSQKWTRWWGPCTQCTMYTLKISSTSYNNNTAFSKTSVCGQKWPYLDIPYYWWSKNIHTRVCVILLHWAPLPRGMQLALVVQRLTDLKL